MKENQIRENGDESKMNPKDLVSEGDKANGMYPVLCHYKKGKYNHFTQKDIDVLTYINTNITTTMELVPTRTDDDSPSLENIRKIMGVKKIKSVHEKLNSLARYDYLFKETRDRVTLLGIAPKGKCVLRDISKNSRYNFLGLSNRRGQLYTEAKTPFELTPNKDRHHKTKVGILIPWTSQPRWDKFSRKRLCKKLQERFTNVEDNVDNLKNSNGSFDFDIETERRCHLFRHKIVVDVFPPKSLKQFETIEDFYEYLRIIEGQTVKILESRLSGLGLQLQKNGVYRSKLVVNEIGKPFDKIAKIVNSLRDQGISVPKRIKSTVDNKFIIEFDRSFLGIDETDFLQTKENVKRPEETKRNWEEFIAYGGDGKVVRGIKDIKEMKSIVGQVVVNQQNITDNQARFSRDMVSYGEKIAVHTSSINKLGIGIEELTKKIEELPRVIKEGVKEGILESNFKKQDNGGL